MEEVETDGAARGGAHRPVAVNGWERCEHEDLPIVMLSTAEPSSEREPEGVARVPPVQPAGG